MIDLLLIHFILYQALCIISLSYLPVDTMTFAIELFSVMASSIIYLR